MPVKKAFNTTNKNCSYRGVKYRLLPGNRTKARLLSGLCGACRFVWNAILEQINEEYKVHQETGSDRPKVSFFSLGPRFTKLRGEVDWLNEYSHAIVKYCLKYQADAWTAFFKGTRQHPRFHSKYGKQSFTAPEGTFKIVGDCIHIQRVGWMKFRRKGGNSYPDGELISVTVSKVGQRWKMSVLYKVHLPEREDDDKVVGVDVNTQNIAYTTSEGERNILELPISELSEKEIKIRRYQRKLARQQKGSGRYKRTKQKIDQLKRKQKNIRTNTAHQQSRKLSNKAYTLVREDLNIKNMSKSAKGTVENPGTNVKAKAGLNRVIQNAGWGRFNTYCDYKFGKVIAVDPKYTSQSCNQCGHVEKDNRKTQSKFKCMFCGHTDHADLNASANILASGIGATARGGVFPLGTLTSREMDTRVAV